MKKRKKVIVKVKPIVQKEKLTLQQEAFCKMYVTPDKDFFGNGVESYLEVYNVDRSKGNWYKTACALASRLLSNDKVCARINQLLEDGGLNDQFVDKQLLFMITQHSDGNVKLGAVREYNKLKARITEKHDFTTDGKPLLVEHLYKNGTTKKNTV